MAWLTGKLAAAGLTARYDAEGFLLLVQGGTLPLHPIFQAYCENGADGREQLVESLLASLSRPTVEEARPRLVPRLYSRTVVEEMRLRGRPLPYRLLTDNVALTLALDQPVSEHFLAAWQLDFEEAVQIARENLRAATQAPPRLLGPGLYTGNWDDANHSARVLLVAEMGLPLRGDLVVFVPTRETLLITGSEEPEGLSLALEHLSQRHGHAVTVVPFRHASGSWERLQVEPVHPHRERLSRLTFDDRYQEYAEQKGLLDSLFRLQGREVRVASCRGFRTQDGLITLSTWVNGAETLLPETDRVMLLDRRLPEDSREVAEPTWAELRERYGDRMEPTEHWPPRWRVFNWR